MFIQLQTYISKIYRILTMIAIARTKYIVPRKQTKVVCNNNNNITVRLYI